MQVLLCFWHSNCRAWNIQNFCIQAWLSVPTKSHVYLFKLSVPHAAAQPNICTAFTYVFIFVLGLFFFLFCFFFHAPNFWMLQPMCKTKLTERWWKEVWCVSAKGVWISVFHAKCLLMAPLKKVWLLLIIIFKSIHF